MDTGEIKRYVLGEISIGVIVCDAGMNFSYVNKRARLFLGRFDFPHEVLEICRRVFEAIESQKLKERFPGEVRLSRRFDGSISNWVFKLAIREKPEPLVAVFISEEPIWNRLNLDTVRMKAGLTRRETDVMRRALEGMKNSEIADELDIGEQTVKDYLSNVYSKLNVTNKFSMLRFLVETSLPG